MPPTSLVLALSALVMLYTSLWWRVPLVVMLLVASLVAFAIEQG